MAVPPAHAPCWRMLASGGLERIRTNNLGTQMLAKRMQLGHYTPEAKAREIHAYYEKWERGLTDEIAQFA